MTQDRWLALVCMAFGIFVILAIPYQTSSTPMPGARGFDLLNGAFFPKIAVALFMIGAIWIFVTGGPSAKEATGDEDAAEPSLSPVSLISAGGLTLLLLAYVAVFEWAGYIVSTALLVAIIAIVCGQRSIIGLLLGAVVFPVILYLFFVNVAGVPLPQPEFL